MIPRRRIEGSDRGSGACYPDSADANEALGEVYLADGQKELA